MMKFFRENVRWIMIAILVLFTLSCFAGYGMYSRGGRGGQGDGTRDYPVAEIDGDRVMRSEIEKGMGELAEQYGKQQKITSADYPTLRQMVLDNLVLMKQVEKETLARGFKADDAEVEKTLASIQDQFPTKEAFQQYLQRSNMTLDQMKEQLHKQLAQQKLMEDVLKPASVDIKEARKFYDSMKDIFYRRPAGFTFNLMAFRDRAAAEKARARLVAGEKWDAITVAFSKDVSNATSFDKPVFVGEKDLATDLQDLKKLAVGKVSQIKQITSDDVMIALKRSVEKERVMTWNEISGDVTRLMLNQKKRELQTKFLEELKKKAQVKILDASIFPAPKVQILTAPASGDVSGDKKSRDQ